MRQFFADFLTCSLSVISERGFCLKDSVNLLDLRGSEPKISKISLTDGFETYSLKDPNYAYAPKTESGVRAVKALGSLDGYQGEIGIYGSGYYNYSASKKDFFSTEPFITNNSDPRLGGPSVLMHLKQARLTKYVWGIHTIVLGSYDLSDLIVDKKNLSEIKVKKWVDNSYPPSPRRITEINSFKKINKKYHYIKLSDLIKSHSFWIKDLFGVEYKFPDPETFILIVPDQKPIPITNGGPFILVKKSDNSIIRNYFFHVKEIRSI